MFMVVYRFGEIMIDFDNLVAKRNGERIDLSPREFKLLKYFIEHKGEAVTREELLRAVWGYSFPSTRRVDMHVSNLRKKVERIPKDPRYIITEYSIGYRFIGSVEVMKLN